MIEDVLVGTRWLSYCSVIAVFKHLLIKSRTVRHDDIMGREGNVIRSRTISHSNIVGRERYEGSYVWCANQFRSHLILLKLQQDLIRSDT